MLLAPAVLVLTDEGVKICFLAVYSLLQHGVLHLTLPCHLFCGDATDTPDCAGHRVLPVSWQRSIRDGAFRKVADGGVMVTAGVTAVLKPRLAARFVTVSRQKEDHRYGPHPRQVM